MIGIVQCSIAGGLLPSRARFLFEQNKYTKTLFLLYYIKSYPLSFYVIIKNTERLLNVL